MADLVLAILKFAAIFTASIFGVLALFGDTQKDGKLTEVGRRVLLGILVSSVVAILIQAVETYKQKQERMEQEQNNAAILRQISRGLYTINDADVTVVAHLSNLTPELKAYIHRIHPYLSKETLIKCSLSTGKEG